MLRSRQIIRQCVLRSGGASSISRVRQIAFLADHKEQGRAELELVFRLMFERRGMFDDERPRYTSLRCEGWLGFPTPCRCFGVREVYQREFVPTSSCHCCSSYRDFSTNHKTAPLPMVRDRVRPSEVDDVKEQRAKTPEQFAGCKPGC